MGKRKVRRPLTTIGWREWGALPDLGIERVKVKIDTGAHTSALHAVRIRVYEEDGKGKVEFDVHPQQRDAHLTVRCVADLVEMRKVRSSNGHWSKRPVIRTTAVIGEEVWGLELTLINRSEMNFRMLLGRQALRSRFVVDAGRSFLLGKEERQPRKAARKPT